MFPVGEILGELSSSMAILDGGDEVVIGLDFAGQLVAHDLDEVITGQQVGGIAVGHAFLGQEHQRDPDQRHVMVPRLPTPDLVVRHAASAFGILKRALNEMPRRLHFRQATQTGLGLGIGQAELQFRAVDLAAHQQIPASRLGFLAVPQPHPLGQAIGDDLPLLTISANILVGFLLYCAPLPIDGDGHGRVVREWT